ncbi:MAG: hypothetical protein IJ892_02070 [Prevotella sp.]|nr:hypothetical protein [Prevotella sp.]
MKKLLIFALSLMAFASTARAQGHWSFDEGAYDMSTVVYTDLVVDGSALYDRAAIGDYEVAAFVGDEVRAKGQVYPVSGTSILLLRFRVWGSQQDLSESITFKAYHNNLEYDLALKNQALPTFTGETLDPGTPNNPLHLYLTEVTDIEMDDIKLNVGETATTLDYVRLTPADATMPNNVSFAYGADADGYYSFKDNGATIKAISPSVDGVSVWVMMGDMDAEGKVYIYQPATSIVQTQTELTVNTGTYIKRLLDDCYTLAPENTTDVVEWTWEMGDDIVDSRYNALNPGDVVLTGTVKGVDGTLRTTISPITVAVHVKQPVTAITTSFGPGMSQAIECNVADDLTPYLIDGTAFDVLPLNASDKGVTLSIGSRSAEGVLALVDGKVTATGAGTGYIDVTAVDGSGVSTVLMVTVHNDATAIAIVDETVSLLYKGEANQLANDVLRNNVEFVPTTATTIYANQTYVSSDNASVVKIGDIAAPGTPLAIDCEVRVMGAGEANITVGIDVKDYLRATFDTENEYVTRESKTFKIVVTQGVNDFTISIADLVQSAGSTITITPVPADAEVDISHLALTATYADNDSWDAATIGALAEGAANTFTATVNPLVPGQVVFTVTYNDGADLMITKASDPVEVAYPLAKSNGWTWKTIPYGHPEVDGLETVFGSNLVEIRTQGEQLYNDPEYGYFGDLDLLTQNKCFKLKMNVGSPETYALYGGRLGQLGTVALRKGWNWIPCPYIFNRTIANAFSGMRFQQGDRLISKDSFAEYDGTSWSGSLEGLASGNGYLFWNAGSEGRTLVYADEFGLGGADEFVVEATSVDGPMGARMQAPAQSSLFGYDASRFRDNMTIVAEVQDVADADNYQAYAFVGDECRGRGISQNGKLFITVHADAGEQVKFVLYDELTGEICEAEQTVAMQQMLGTLSAPFRLTSHAVTTGIHDVERSSTSEAAKPSATFFDERSGKAERNGQRTFDLGGRRVNARQNGVQLQRQQDGTVRKVIK